MRMGCLFNGFNSGICDMWEMNGYTKHLNGIDFTKGEEE